MIHFLRGVAKWLKPLFSRRPRPCPVQQGFQRFLKPNLAVLCTQNQTPSKIASRTFTGQGLQIEGLRFTLPRKGMETRQAMPETLPITSRGTIVATVCSVVALTAVVVKLIGAMSLPWQSDVF